MAEIVYLEPARRDFERFRDFMLAGGVATENVSFILNGIIDSIDNLSANPRLGYAIGARHGYGATPYRAYITGQYIAVYEVASDTVEIRRIYHLREDYIRDILIME